MHLSAQQSESNPIRRENGLAWHLQVDPPSENPVEPAPLQSGLADLLTGVGIVAAPDIDELKPEKLHKRTPAAGLDLSALSGVGSEAQSQATKLPPFDFSALNGVGASSMSADCAPNAEMAVDSSSQYYMSAMKAIF